MFKIDQSHGLKFLADRFENAKIKFQYEKRHEIRDALHNIFEIDSIFKKLKHEDIETLEKLHKADPRHVDHFLSAASELIRKIINLMKEEELELSILHDNYLHHPKKIKQEKHNILMEERSEESYARRLENWAENMSNTVEIVNATLHSENLAMLQKRLKNLIKDMHWFEDEIEEEIKSIKSNEDLVV